MTEPAEFIVPLALIAIIVCCMFLWHDQKDVDLPTERSGSYYRCHRCGQSVSRGKMLKYIYESVLCDRCWFDDHGRLKPVEVHARGRRRNGHRATATTLPLPFLRGGAVFIVVQRRRG